eukprot:234668_1
MLALIDMNWDSSSKTTLLFDAPCDFVTFLAKIQSFDVNIAGNVLNQLISYIRLKITDVFNIFGRKNDQNKIVMNEKQMKIMHEYSYRKELDWRSTFTFPCDVASFIENWSTMSIYEQHDILDETTKKK